jgi:far upstream element-binding protein
MKMSQESTCASGKKTLVIVGSAMNIESAKRAVLDIVEVTPERIPMQPMSTPVAMIEVVVPRSAAGVIIGKQGGVYCLVLCFLCVYLHPHSDTIRRLQAETDTKIQFKTDEDPNSGERVLVIRGSEENVRIGG